MTNQTDDYDQELLVKIAQTLTCNATDKDYVLVYDLVEAEKAKAVREADKETEKALEERDEAEEWADRLAYAIAPIEIIGEHSNVNNPWENALAQLSQEEE